MEGLPRIVQVRLGAQHACAVDEDANVWCWGEYHLAGTHHGEASERLNRRPSCAPQNRTDPPRDGVTSTRPAASVIRRMGEADRRSVRTSCQVAVSQEPSWPFEGLSAVAAKSRERSVLQGLPGQ